MGSTSCSLTLDAAAQQPCSLTLWISLVVAIVVFCGSFFVVLLYCDRWLDRRVERWYASRRSNKHRAPEELYVVSPNVHMGCTGEYELVHGERPNGQPLWKKRDGDRWLYSGSDGRWYICGLLSHQSGFACASGYICNRLLHRGVLPHLIGGTWEYNSGTAWLKDTAIQINDVEVLFQDAQTNCVGDTNATTCATSRLTGSLAQDLPATNNNSSSIVNISESADLWRLIPQLEDLGGCCSIGYTVTSDILAVTYGVSISTPVVDHLTIGTTVQVTELIEATHSKLGQVIRGRIQSPPGWISISSATRGCQWATRASISEVSTQDEVSNQDEDSYLAPCTEQSSLDFQHPEYLEDVPLSMLRDTTAPGSLLVAGLADVTRVPQVLSVTSPNGQQRCQGSYELVVGHRPNGQHLWKQRGGPHWMYCSAAGRWCIGGHDVKEEGFARNSGWISQSTVHHPGEMPDEVSALWHRWDGTAFQRDREISVVSASWLSLLEPPARLEAI